MFRLLKAVKVPIQGILGVETQSKVRSESGVVVLGPKFQWNMQYSGYVRFPLQSDLVAVD